MGKAATAAGTVAAAVIYNAGRIATNVLAWAESGAITLLQIAALKAMLDRQKNHYDDIANRQIGYVETALNQYILDLENVLLPTFKDAYPDIPQVSQYNQVDTAGVVWNQMVENIQNLPKTEEYTVRVNHLHRYNYLARMEILSPGFKANLLLVGQQMSDLIQGRMSTGDVVEILTDQAEQDALSGRIGAGGRTTHRNLGISRMRSQAAGRDEMARWAAMFNTHIAPLAAEVNIHDQMLPPSARLQLALQETQLLQQSLQNVYNAAAQKPPYKLAELQAKLSKINTHLIYTANKGNMVNQFVPNEAAIFGPMMQSLMQGIQKRTEVDKAAEWQHPAMTHPGESATPLI